jgi:carboxymethylenebutenolidase
MTSTHIEARPVAHNHSKLLTESEVITCSDGFRMPIHVTRPDDDSRHAGVLFVYEAFGMNGEMQRIASEIANAGYAVIIPDLFARGSWIRCIRTLMSELKRGEGQSVRDLLEARTWLAGRAYCEPERIGVMGLCMGGGFALLLARTGLFRVSAPFYGQAPKDLEGACPIVASYGARDNIAAGDYQRLRTMLEGSKIPYDLKLYPNAGHSFMNRAPNKLMSLLGPILPVHATYEPEVARDATERLLTFLRTHL